MIKVKPYLTKDIQDKIRGKATKIILEDKYLDYLIDFIKDEVAEITKTDILGEEIIEERDFEDKIYIGGRISKDSIICITHSINTVLTKEGVEYVPEIEVEYKAGDDNLIFSCQTEEEQMNIYKQLIDWKWN